MAKPSYYCFAMMTMMVLILIAATVNAFPTIGSWPAYGRSGQESRWTTDGVVGWEEEEEEEMETEISRRILAASSYISYGALRRNSVPCSRRGASYYNCRAGGQANPYSRGCSAITRCRR